MSDLDSTLLQQKQALLDDMLHYMKYGAADDEEDEEYDPDFEADYTEQDVEKCDQILTGYLEAVQSHHGAGDDVLMNDLKTVVLDLNELNEECDCGLIETEERESLCLLLDAALRQAGMTLTGDLTEEWREW